MSYCWTSYIFRIQCRGDEKPVGPPEMFNHTLFIFNLIINVDLIQEKRHLIKKN